VADLSATATVTPRYLDGQIAIVTGAAQGIGKAVAIGLAEVGATVALWDVDEAMNRATTNELRAQGWTASPYVGDVGSPEQVSRLITQVHGDFGSIDILVNNAAVTRPSMLHRMTDDEWDSVIRVNLSGAFYTTRAVAPIMIEQRRGTIVNITALGALRGAMGQVNYIAAKAGIVGLTKAAARELARYKVRVNAIAPGIVETRMSQKLLSDERFRDSYLAEIPLGRVAQPTDIARVVRFLVSEESSYMTGQVLTVSGGSYM
jgi:3-oxoacyl-[acyl-carrier protein] reductase